MTFHPLKWRSKSLSVIDIAGVGIGAVLSLTFLFAVFQPISRNHGQHLAARKSSASERLHLATVQNSVQSLQKEVERMQHRISQDPLQLITADSLNTRLFDVAILCSESNLGTTEMKPSEGVMSANFLIIPIHIAGHGNYCDCAKFIHLLHQNHPDISLYSFKLIETPEPTASTCAFEFELRWLATPATLTDPQPNITADIR